MRPLPLQRISELLEYQEDTGKLFWKVTRGGTAVKGSIAGCINAQGYVQLQIDNAFFCAHRIIYALKTGREIFSDIDHIDGDRTNNVFSNLRESSKSSNAKNRMSRGTYKVKTGWVAGITVDYKKKHLGVFSTEQEAHEAYLAAKAKYHPESAGRKYSDEGK